MLTPKGNLLQQRGATDKECGFQCDISIHYYFESLSSVYFGALISSSIWIIAFQLVVLLFGING